MFVFSLTLYVILMTQQTTESELMPQIYILPQKIKDCKGS